jgi:hypothetical protein
VLTGGQFFAALRLVIHAELGDGVDRGLAFVQGALSFRFVSFVVAVAIVVCPAIFPCKKSAWTWLENGTNAYGRKPFEWWHWIQIWERIRLLSFLPMIFYV